MTIKEKQWWYELWFNEDDDLNGWHLSIKLFICITIAKYIH